MPADFDLVAPRADALMESLRATGYSLPDAVSDLIDNSITAVYTMNINCKDRCRENGVIHVRCSDGFLRSNHASRLVRITGGIKFLSKKGKADSMR